ncbi:unnamed protein product [Ambrosiozyma monospora]|uniref:Unnamed protein product n=1 Tax=Ambrosiozyma monospora TaxID=43982 RepID=A0ACB5SSK1_AMBMO|nr:unnamed protein product [Ambrosiozyma monospora]
MSSTIRMSDFEPKVYDSEDTQTSFFHHYSLWRVLIEDGPPSYDSSQSQKQQEQQFDQQPPRGNGDDTRSSTHEDAQISQLKVFQSPQQVKKKVLKIRKDYGNKVILTNVKRIILVVPLPSQISVKLSTDLKEEQYILKKHMENFQRFMIVILNRSSKKCF